MLLPGSKQLPAKSLYPSTKKGRTSLDFKDMVTTQQTPPWPVFTAQSAQALAADQALMTTCKEP
eukprot:8589365-Lingulodinium_polyedra.AAC.1